MGERETPVEVGGVPVEVVIRAAEIGRTTLDQAECHVMECSPSKGRVACDTEQALYKGRECPDRLNRGAV